MTLSELLEKLKLADPETYGDIVEWIAQLGTWADSDLGLALIQNSIQRACENHRGERDYLDDWFWKIDQLERGKYEVIIYDRVGQISADVGDSPAEALLAAYIAALEEAKR